MYDAENMVLRSALIGLFPKADSKANLAFEKRCGEVADILVVQFERQDTVLGTIETRRKLVQNIKYIDHFGQFTRAVDAIMALRRAVPPVFGQRQHFLKAVIDATLKEATALGLSKYKSWAHLAIYCALVVRGPPLFHFSLDCPEDILQPLPHVPSEGELNSDSGEQ